MVQDSKKVLHELFTTLNADTTSIDCLSKLIQAPKLDRWRIYAPEDWFVKHESICETNLTQLLAAKQPKIELMKKTLLLSEIFPPVKGGSGRWFWESYADKVGGMEKIRAVVDTQ